jgi:hypothetical protein
MNSLVSLSILTIMDLIEGSHSTSTPVFRVRLDLLLIMDHGSDSHIPLIARGMVSGYYAGSSCVRWRKL